MGTSGAPWTMIICCLVSVQAQTPQGKLLLLRKRHKVESERVINEMIDVWLFSLLQC
jgi:hypothetical protein